MSRTDDLDRVADAYVAGYPLVVTLRTMQVIGGFFGVNRLRWQPTLADHTTRAIVAPNRDTLYSTAVCDLRPEPLVLELPEVVDRYSSYQLLDAWTESFEYVGTRTTGGRAGRWALVAPGWQGELPDDVVRLDAPTPQVFVLGRFHVLDHDDVAGVHAIADRTSLRPLSEVVGGEAPAPAPPLGPAPGRPRDVPATAAFFPELAEHLAVNPANAVADGAAFAALEQLGVPLSTGAELDLDDLGGDLVALLEQGAARGSDRIDALPDGRPELTGGWSVNRHVGTYGEDLLLRALVARIGWGANVAEEALYPLTRTDHEGELLHGSNTYRLRFPAGGQPPVHAFWSLCAYGDDLFFTEHPTDRYHVGDRAPHLVEGDDGSLEVVLAHERPEGADETVTWLPVPADRFRLMMRLYLPEDALVHGTYEYPAVERVEPA